MDAGPVTLELVSFGVGGAGRPGSWAGVLVTVADASDTPRELVIRIDGFDADGDTPAIERTIASNPGVATPVWLYLWLPYTFNVGDILTVSAFEAVEGSGRGFRAGQLLGRKRISPPSLRDRSEDLIGVIGRESAGLAGYGGGGKIGNWAPLDHEATAVITGLDPTTLPDRWLGLMPFETIVWVRGNPADLSSDRASALREWIERGGHLVVVLPAVGREWDRANAYRSELLDLLPMVSVRRVEGADIGRYRAFLTKQQSLPVTLPRSAVVHELVPDDVAPFGMAMRILDDADGRCLVARRLVGTGAVTLVGLSIAQRNLGRYGLPEADVFWHRVLGRRGVVMSRAELARFEDDRKVNLANRSAVWLDGFIGNEVAKTGQSAAGVLLGFVVFIVYWLVAGPLGYAILKRKGWVRHAWVAYVAAAGVFTAIAWGGARAIRIAHVEASHLTFVDHVYGQDVERARSWVSLLIPKYGDVRLSIDKDEPTGKPRFHNTITSWAPPTPGSGGGSGFPDVRSYRVSATEPGELRRVPTRSTVKQLQIDWAGPPRWRMPTPDGDGLRLIELPSRGGGRKWRIEGTLTHDLPAEMHDVVVVVNPRQKPMGMALRQYLIASAEVYAISSWKPGEALDLDTLTTTTTKSRDREFISAQKYFEDLVPRPGVIDRLSSSDATELLMALAFYTQLAPPDWSGQDLSSRTLALRQAAHGWDLGRWFTQPCLIIVGHVGTDSAKAAEDRVGSPVPLYVDGQPVPMTGRTVVRWVYPFPADPPDHLRQSQLPEEPAGGQG